MGHLTLAEGELRFAELIWEREPIPSGELGRLCEEAFGWKKSTTYTVLKKLCSRGFFKNEQSIVTALISREEYEAIQSEAFVQDTFGGSLPRFLTAFMSRQKLSDRQIEELRKLIDDYREE